jgi:hypothetical protein
VVDFLTCSLITIVPSVEKGAAIFFSVFQQVAAVFVDCGHKNLPLYVTGLYLHHVFLCVDHKEISEMAFTWTDRRKDFQL